MTELRSNLFAYGELVKNLLLGSPSNMFGEQEIKRLYKKSALFLKKLPRILAERAFLVSLALISTALILGVIVFYKYSFLAEKKEPEIKEQPLIIDEKALQELLEMQQIRQNRLDQAEFKEYNNPF